MKVLLMQPWISYRGAEAVSVQQTYWLNEIGHKADLVAVFLEDGKMPPHADEITILLPPAWFSLMCRRSRLFFFLFGWIGLLYVLLKHAKIYDVLNAHNLPTVWFAALFGKLWGITTVWMVHTVPEKVSWENKKSIVDYLTWLLGASKVDIWLMNWIDVIISASPVIQEKVRKRYNRDSTVAFNGVRALSVRKKDLLPEVKELHDNHSLTLLQVGTLHSQKRQYLSIEALKIVRDKGIDACLVLVSDGPDREKLERLVSRLKLGEHVCFTGFVDADKLGIYYDIADLHLLPSVRDTFPATPLEAMSLGTTSILSKEIGVIEVIGTYSLVVDKPTKQSVSDAIIKYAKNKSYWNKKAQSGKSYVRRNLTWKSNVKNIAQMIESHREREVDADVYDEAYFNIHHEKPVHEALKKERETRLQRALELLDVKEGMKVLDMGSGNGELSYMIAKKGCDVVGIDYSKKAVQLAKKNQKKWEKNISKRITFKHMDAQDMGLFKDNSFDRIVAIDVFEHIYPETLSSVIREMRRVIKSKGKVVVETAPNQFFLHPISWIARKILGHGFESDEYHINVYNYFRFKKDLERLGGSVEVDVKNDSHHYFSARIGENTEIPYWMKNIAEIADFAHENPLSEFVILNTPLKVFLAHDLWGVVEMEK